jgi:hypothetical protein
MNTKKKGDIGIARAITAFASAGWTVCIPITDSQDYDLVVDFPDGLRRVQVKYVASKTPFGSYTIQLGIRGGTKGGIWKRPEAIIFDLLFVACADGTDWLVPREVIRSSFVVGRPTKNSQYEFRGSVTCGAQDAGCSPAA